MIVATGVETLVEKKCGRCGIWFAVPDWFEDEALKEGPRGGWHCPNGHARHYLQGQREKDEIRTLKDRLLSHQAREAHLVDQRDATERSLRATKGQVTKLKKKAAAGACPCCKRTFQNVSRHMQNQHPEFVKEQQAK